MSPLRWAFFSGAGVAACIVLLSACDRTRTRDQELAKGEPAPPVPVYDHALTDTARVLAGMVPEDPVAFSNVTERSSWQDYRATLGASWAEETNGRFAAIATWRDRELRNQLKDCQVLLYPFSGPDVLHATLFFPRCETYVLFGLEHLGSVPRLGGLSPARVDRLIGDLAEVISDLFTRHYFITEEMMKDLGQRDLDGVTPLLLMLLARQNALILGADKVRLTETGDAVPVTDSPAGSGVTSGLIGTRVRFLAAAGGRPQQVIYFRAPADNSGLARQPVVQAYVRHLAPAITFMKSASYLLHTSPFSTMRSAILDTSSMILQDDSGVPYRFLARPTWEVKLFGQYAKPIADFNYGFQPDLDAAYRAAPPTPLPFSFGYHWRDGNWGMMLAVRATSLAGRK